MNAQASTAVRKLNHEEAPGIEVYFAKVGPDEARELLKLNTKGQRMISEHAVERYAGDMATQDWIINGDTIKISKDNELLDGQHRLTSIVVSGEAQVLLIVWGVDKDAMLTIDAGRKRTYADLLRMRGIAHHTLVAALIGRSWWWDKGNYAVRNLGRVDSAQFLGATPSNAQKDAHKEAMEAKYGFKFEQAARFGNTSGNKRAGINTSTWGTMWILLTVLDHQRRDAGEESDLRELFFHEIFVESRDTKMGYPITALHNRLNRTDRGELDNVDQLDMLITVFNGWFNNKTNMETLRKPPRPLAWNRVEQLVELKEFGI
jgi:hypothetical protein